MVMPGTRAVANVQRLAHTRKLPAAQFANANANANASHVHKSFHIA